MTIPGDGEDVRDHFRASLETSEYENTSNIFHVTAAKETFKLLKRCETLLKQYSVVNQKQSDHIQKDTLKVAIDDRPKTNVFHEDVSYLDMTAANKKMNESKEYLGDMMNSAYSDKTFRCSISMTEGPIGNILHRSATSLNSEKNEKILQHKKLDIVKSNSSEKFIEDVQQVYDVCLAQVDSDETEKAITPDIDLINSADCPYIDLPAGHLTIQQSSKYGQLNRIEKRLFFDQSKKYYCGILNDWLLCYADGPVSSCPTHTLYLKSNGIEIEHSGEGKKRDICFQITTADPNIKFVFQANNEVDAKEWIHAIEAAIRCDKSSVAKNNRKLPTPPLFKRLTYNGCHGKINGTTSNFGSSDSIYEEPSPLYQFLEPTDLLITKTTQTINKEIADQPPDLPTKNNNSIDIEQKYEYDIPKCPPQPLKNSTDQVENALHDSDTFETLMLNPMNKNQSTLSAIASRSVEKTDFQAVIKDVHNKLSSQLSAGQSIERLKKTPIKKTYSCSSNDSESIALTTPPQSLKEQKKQRKSITPNGSIQKKNESNEKSAKNWFLNRLNKTTSSTRSMTISSPPKTKQSEKENLLNSVEVCDNYDGSSDTPILKCSSSSSSSNNKSKVNMIINQFEASGHLAMFSVETLANNAVSSLSAFCDSDCNNYEPIMAVSSPPNSFMKKV
ncbi:uncharacterized protein LOC119674920 [Teleopsis dalmanni]|uniref:uncharacterized protein LOC119674920 n=1 Tax=Teleopsis dalmanni TaxID=139649 RepID=UPI0018CF1125|nr:uncharacterized protein LOC119674920 [Teleopsis dalmanni]